MSQKIYQKGDIGIVHSVGKNSRFHPNFALNSETDRRESFGLFGSATQRKSYTGIPRDLASQMPYH